jgi:hypothetical protein
MEHWTHQPHRLVTHSFGVVVFDPQEEEIHALKPLGKANKEEAQ